MFSNKKVSKEMSVSNIIDAAPAAREIMIKRGMKFVSEDISPADSFEKIAKVHGLQDKDIEEIVTKRVLDVNEEGRGHIHAEDIVKNVCVFYAIKPTLLKGPRRNSSLVKARQICMYLLKTEIGLTFAEIGNILGGRDHTTIMHGVEKIEGMIIKKPFLREEISGITIIQG